MIARGLVVAAAFVLVSGSARAVDATDRSSVSFPLARFPQGKIDLEIEHLLGTLSYATWDEDRIEIVTVRVGSGATPAAAAAHRDSIRLEALEQGRTIRAATLAWGFPDFHRAVAYVIRGEKPAIAHLSVRAPRRVRAWLYSERGSIGLKDVIGQVSATTHDMGIDVRGAKGLLVLRTDSGAVWLDGEPDAKVRFSSDSGHLHARAFQGDLDVKTRSGSIQVEYRALGRGAQHLFTDSGDVEVSLPLAADVEVDVHADIERITSSLRLSRVQHAARRMTGTMNEPRCRMEIRTRQGRVRLAGR